VSHKQSPLQNPCILQECSLFFCFSCANPLSKFIDAAVTIQALQPQDPQRVIVDTTVQEKAVATPRRQPLAGDRPATR
jgi:hypothetical protein